MTRQISRSSVSTAVSVLTALLVAVFLAAGIVKLIPIEFERHGFIHFGYPLWFMTLVGFLEIAGAIVMAFAATRALGALLNAAIMVGAVCSHLRAGDGFGMAAPAFVLLVLLVIVAVANRDSVRDVIANRFVSRSA